MVGQIWDENRVCCVRNQAVFRQRRLYQNNDKYVRCICHSKACCCADHPLSTHPSHSRSQADAGPLRCAARQSGGGLRQQPRGQTRSSLWTFFFFLVGIVKWIELVLLTGSNATEDNGESSLICLCCREMLACELFNLKQSLCNQCRQRLRLLCATCAFLASHK